MSIVEMNRATPITITMTDPERVKRILSIAMDRHEGLVINAKGSTKLGRTLQTKFTFKDTKPSHVCIKDDGRFGVCIEGASFISDTPFEGRRFSKWSETANALSTTDVPYGQPDCTFRKTN